MKLLTGKEKNHRIFKKLEDAEVRICPRKTSETCLNFLALFGLFTMVRCSYTQVGIKYLPSCSGSQMFHRNSLHESQLVI